MAYVVGGKAIPYFQASGQGTNFTIPVTPGHQSGDVIYVVVMNTSSAGSAMTCSGYTSKGVTTVVSSVSRTQVFWKYATSSSEADITIVGQDADFTAEVSIIRGCDQTDPFDTFGNTDFTSNVASQTTGTLTTTANNCLIHTSIFLRTGGKQLPSQTSDMGNFVPLSKYTNNSLATTLTGYRIKRTAGTTTAVSTINNIASTSTGRAFQAAFKDANPSSPTLPPEFSANFEVVKLHMGTTGAGTPTDSFSRNETTTWNDLTNMTPTTIDSLTVASSTPTVSQSPFTMPDYDWGQSTIINTSTSAVDATGRWHGASHTLSSHDMSNKIISLTFGMNSLAATQAGAKGCIVVFEDGSGNWEAFQLSKRQGMQNNYAYTVFIAPGVTTPIDSSGTMDWTDVAKVGYAYHRVTTSTITRGMFVRLLALISEPIVYGGSAEAPINAEFIGRMMNFWGSPGLAPQQGSGQIITKGNFTYGDGSTTSYIDLSANSNEQPKLPDGSFENQFWQGGASALRTRYNLSSNDTVKLSRSVLSSPINQTIDHAGSTPTSFEARGCTYIKQSGELINGVTYTRTTFDQCGNLSLNSAVLDTCTVSSSTASVALTVADPGDISNTAFVSAGTGHAVELTTPGTYDFTGNTFTGYGADTTSDAAIYNNSGGAVTLTLAAGDATPTVKNGAGASTTFASPTVDITISGLLAGTRVQVYNVTQATEIDNDTTAGTSYSYTVTTEADDGDVIRVRLAYLGKLPYEVNGVFSDVAGLAILGVLDEDTVYTTYGVDGSAVSTITWDSGNGEIEFDEAGTTWSAKDLYAWYNYYVTTATGIDEVFGLITARDEGNLELGDVLLDNQDANSLAPEDDIRVYRSDDAWPGKNPSTGGGDFGFYSTGTIFIKNINTATNVITGDISDVPTVGEIADAVWDEPKSGHTTSGTFGKSTQDIESNSDATQAKVDQL